MEECCKKWKKGGDDLSKARDVDFSIVFEEESCAFSFVSLIRNNFSNVRYSKIEDEDDALWDVTATKFMKLKYEEISETEDYLKNASEKFGGKIDGWGCFNL